LGICASLAAGGIFLFDREPPLGVPLFGKSFQAFDVRMRLLEYGVLGALLLLAAMALGVTNFKNGMNHLYDAKAPLWVIAFVWVAYAGLVSALFGLALHLDSGP
jgi:hypothetical protein